MSYFRSIKNIEESLPAGANSIGSILKIEDDLSSYKVSDIDDTGPNYYGFVDKDGAWYIMKEDTTAGSYRYCKGVSDYPTNWDNRTTLTYDYFDIVS